MLFLIVQFVVLAAIIVVAGIFLTRYADVIAESTGLGRALAGLVLLAAATSLPELAVDCAAALIGAPDLAVGALLGSSLFNLLILGVLDFCHGREDRIISPVSAGHALSALATIILTAFVTLFVVLEKQLPLHWYGIGLGPVLVFLFYGGSLRLIYLDQMLTRDQSASANSSDAPPISTQRAVMGYLGATAVIFVAARFLAPAADELARQSGLGGTFVGSTFVALTTSLPEVVTTAAAVRMGAFDMAVGNVLGSNAFNMAILLPVDICYRPGSLLQNAEIAHAITGAAVIVVTGIATLGLLYRPPKRCWFIEPGAGLVVILTVAALVSLYFLSPAAAS